MPRPSPIRSRALLATLAAAAVLAGLLTSVIVGCGPLPDDRPRISIEFGAYPELFEGRDVIIDGMVVGKLESTGAATRISFPVEIGSHEVRIKHPTIDCEPAHVEIERKAQKIRLMADLEERAATDGGMSQAIVLR